MMHGRCLSVAVVMLFMVLAVFNSGAWAGGNVNLFYGQKILDSGDWKPVEAQREYGVMIDFKAENWPLSIAVDALFSDDDGDSSGVQVEGKTREFNIGVRKYILSKHQFTPYVGGGLAYITAEASASLSGLSASIDDSNIGFWLEGGAVYTFARHFNIGLDVRYSMAEVTFNGVDGEAGGTHFLVFMGFQF